MHERGVAVAPGLEWLENHLSGRGLTTHAVLARERQRQAANQVSIGNCVTTLRVLSALDWAAFFERASRVEAELRQDPAGVYARQDFPTRDRYRREVEKLSRGSRYDEGEVARQAVGMAARRAHSEPPVNHVGYYLIDRGRPELERLLRYRPKARDAALNFVLGRPRLVYFGALAVVAAVAVGALASYAAGRTSGAAAAVLAVAAVLLALPPAGDIAVSLVNYWLSSFLPPRVLPKLLFKEGVPADCAAFVVMPTLLTRPQSAAGLLEHLEVHYLSNPDPHLRFALLTDFTDAPAEHMPEDDAIVRAALDGVRALNERYADGGPDRFFLFHRRRLWNEAEGCWMGWERKRGKLLEFNRLLRGARDTSYATLSGDVGRLPRIRYVITLDADTQLPHEAARRLVATLAHPLNRPRFDPVTGRVVAGYGVLQPRISLTLTRPPQSRFARIFGGSAGLDPYTTAVSDVYLDLFGVGTFTGKGIYDVDAFEAAAGRAFPENRILSHDLIEGNYARCGLVTDIELFDDFPASYLAFARREHRWVRGDWQILPWLFPHVPAPRGETRRNPLPLVERWKVFDNLRRRLGPPALFLLLVLGWTVLPGSPWVWTAAVLVVLFLPLLLQVAGVPVRFIRSIIAGSGGTPSPRAWRTRPRRCCWPRPSWPNRRSSWPTRSARTLVRLFVTRRRLLEWETAAATERRLAGGLATFVRVMWFSPAVAVLLAFGLFLGRPDSLAAAGPFLIAWAAAPLIAFWVSRPPRVVEETLTAEERKALRRVARKTWGFFETFVGDGGPLAAAGQLPGRPARGRRPPHLAHQHGAVPDLQPRRPRPRLPQPGRPPRAAGEDLRHVRQARTVPRAFLQLVRHADAQAAAADLPLDGGQRQPARLPDCAQAGAAREGGGADSESGDLGRAGRYAGPRGGGAEADAGAGGACGERGLDAGGRRGGARAAGRGAARPGRVGRLAAPAGRRGDDADGAGDEARPGNRGRPRGAAAPGRGVHVPGARPTKGAGGAGALAGAAPGRRAGGGRGRPALARFCGRCWPGRSASPRSWTAPKPCKRS